jgi:ATP-dependent DNA helicase DinG
MTVTDPDPNSSAPQNSQDDVLAALRQVCAPLGGEERPGQNQMAWAVARAAAQERHLIVQAGTGVGKSLAYLVPLLLGGYKVLISTATLALQDQLDRKDLPHLAKYLGDEHPFRWAILKGRSNYLCRQRWAEQQQKLIQDEIPARDYRRLTKWAEDTVTGDKAELPYELDPPVWRAVSVSSDECPGTSKCPQGKQCWAERARQTTYGADIIVVNHHLLVMNWLSDGQILPPHDVIVIDEAHELVHIAASCLGQRLTAAGIKRFGRLAERVLANCPQVGELNVAADQWEAAARAAKQSVSFTQDTIPADLMQAGTHALEAVWHLSRVLRNTEGSKQADWETKRDRALKYCKQLQEKLIMVVQPDEDNAVWAEQGAVCREPIDVAPDLSRLAWSNYPAVVLCSATVPADLPFRLGLTDHIRIDVASPFDYAANGKLFVPRGLPSPKENRAAWEQAVLTNLPPLLEAAKGRAMILCTSWGMVRLIKEHLAGTSKWDLLIQGERPKLELLRRFKNGDGVLVATRSFWGGIDITGLALILVIIDKLPFATPDQPALVALRQKLETAGGNPFKQIDLPEAAMYLAQGAGRLLRTKLDRGVVAVFDPRLVEKNWGHTILSQLPPLAVTRDSDEVLQFLESIEDVPRDTLTPMQIEQDDLDDSDSDDSRKTAARNGSRRGHKPASPYEPATDLLTLSGLLSPDEDQVSADQPAPGSPAPQTPSAAAWMGPDGTFHAFGRDLGTHLVVTSRDPTSIQRQHDRRALCGAPVRTEAGQLDLDGPQTCPECAAAVRTGLDWAGHRAARKAQRRPAGTDLPARTETP